MNNKPIPKKQQRFPMERDYNCRIVGAHDEGEYVEEMLAKYFKEFPTVDCYDLMRIVMFHGMYMAGRENIAFYDE